MNTSNLTIEQRDEIANTVVKGLLASLRDAKHKASVNISHYERDECQFTGLGICPTKGTYTVDIIQVMQSLDEVDFIQMCGEQQTIKGWKQTQYLRLMGSMKGLIIMCDIYLKKTDLNC